MPNYGIIVFAKRKVYIDEYDGKLISSLDANERK